MTPKETVYQHVARVTRVPEDSLNDQSASNNVPSWDSLAHILLIATLEESFDIRFPMKDITEMKNLGELVARVEELCKQPK